MTLVFVILAIEGSFVKHNFALLIFFVGTFEGDLKCKSSKEKHYVARFTIEPESDIPLHYQCGGTFALDLDLSTCIANRHVDAIIWIRTITVTILDEGIEFRLQTDGLDGDCDCPEILTKQRLIIYICIFKKCLNEKTPTLPYTHVGFYFLKWTKS
jgi:hypothetical protein